MAHGNAWGRLDKGAHAVILGQTQGLSMGLDCAALTDLAYKSSDRDPHDKITDHD